MPNVVVLDMGSGNTCKNDTNYIVKMINNVKLIYTGEVILYLKWQLFENAGDNIPLTAESFRFAYDYAKSMGLKTTASVFDKASLGYLLQFDIPFVKISCNKDNYGLMQHVPNDIPIYTSYTIGKDAKNTLSKHLAKFVDIPMACVPKYPATPDDYERIFTKRQLKYAISDHTEDFSLYDEFKPKLVEWHYKLEDSTGLDAGTFARTPAQLSKYL